MLALKQLEGGMRFLSARSAPGVMVDSYPVASRLLSILQSTGIIPDGGT
jgi:hypothetical protein